LCSAIERELIWIFYVTIVLLFSWRNYAIQFCIIILKSAKYSELYVHYLLMHIWMWPFQTMDVHFVCAILKNCHLANVMLAVTKNQVVGETANMVLATRLLWSIWKAVQLTTSQIALVLFQSIASYFCNWILCNKEKTMSLKKSVVFNFCSSMRNQVIRKLMGCPMQGPHGQWIVTDKKVHRNSWNSPMWANYNRLWLITILLVSFAVQYNRIVLFFIVMDLILISPDLSLAMPNGGCSITSTIVWGVF